ncbi:MAG: XRE family transcriptional regulator [Nitrospirae bacterium]|nr:MAG: XRE family transcriptional regulator [Nitrospirota bacterium]
MPKSKRKPATDAVAIIHRRYYEGKPDRLVALDQARANDDVARKIAALRTEAGLSQRQLAKLVGTTASVICRLEDADYKGHSLAMLQRIAAALDRRVTINFVKAQAGIRRLRGKVVWEGDLSETRAGHAP